MFFTSALLLSRARVCLPFETPGTRAWGNQMAWQQVKPIIRGERPVTRGEWYLIAGLLVVWAVIVAFIALLMAVNSIAYLAGAGGHGTFTVRRAVHCRRLASSRFHRRWRSVPRKGQMTNAGMSATVTIARGTASTMTAMTRASGWPRRATVRTGGSAAGIRVYLASGSRCRLSALLYCSAVAVDRLREAHGVLTQYGECMLWPPASEAARQLIADAARHGARATAYQLERWRASGLLARNPRLPRPGPREHVGGAAGRHGAGRVARRLCAPRSALPGAR